MHRTTIGWTFYFLEPWDREKPAGRLAVEAVFCRMTVFPVQGANTPALDVFLFYLQLFCAICTERCQIWLGSEPSRGQSAERAKISHRK
jgi:hypothetical protein